MPIKVKQVVTSLTSKGFEQLPPGKHIRFALHDGSRQLGVSTLVSHGERELGDFLISKMSHQLFLSRAEFFSLIECPLSREAYLALLRERGVI